MSTAPAPEPRGWEHCGHGAHRPTEPVGCRGRRVPGHVGCLAHVADADRDTYLAGLAPGADIDHRGTPFTHALLAELLHAVTDPATGRPHLGAARFGGAAFSGTADFGKVTFSGAAWFSGATFSGHALFGGTAFSGGAATFSDAVSFRGARFSRAASFHGATFSDVASFDQAKFSDATFDEATFSGAGTFGWARFSGQASFKRARFFDDAFFERARFSDDAWFGEATFAGTAWFSGATFSGDAAFYGATIATRRLGPFLCRGDIDLEGAVFKEPVTVEIAAHAVHCAHSRWESTATLRLRHATVDLSDAVLSSPVTVIAHPAFFTACTGGAVDESLLADADRGVRVSSVRGVDAAHLVLTDTDLSACRFSRAFRLDQLHLEGHCAFAPVPVGLHLRHGVLPYRWTRRRTLSEEHRWRAATTTGNPDPPEGWRRGSVFDRTPRPAEVAATYRQLRKAFEDSKNEPGAADFYYGEMEMRRHDRAETTWAERLLLRAYWLLPRRHLHRDGLPDYRAHPARPRRPRRPRTRQTVTCSTPLRRAPTRQGK